MSRSSIFPTELSLSTLNVQEPTLTRDQELCENSNRPTKTILAVQCKDHKIGCAVFTKEFKKLDCFLDMNFSSFDIINEFKELYAKILAQVNPSVVLIPTSFPQEFEKLVYDKDDATEYEVKLRPSQEFSKQNAISKMENALASNPKIFQPSYEQTVALSKSWLRQNDPTSRIDLSPFYSSFFIDGNDLGAECIGSLVSLFEAEEGSSFDSSISAFEIVSFNDIMLISNDCMYSLKIFETNVHPNFHSSEKSQKVKALCLFDILNQTCSSMGQSLMRSWFYRPSTNLNIIKSRQEFISILIDPRNSDLYKEFRKSLRGIKNVPRIIIDIEVGRAKLEDWNGLLTFFKSFIILKESVSKLIGGTTTELYHHFQSTLPVTVIRQNIQNIEGIIDFELSLLLKRIVVQKHVDPDLDRVRDIYDRIEEVLSSVAVDIFKGIGCLSQPINVMYFPQLGYLIVFDNTFEEESKPLVDQNMWECIFSTDTHSYFKSEEMRQMDKEYGDIYGIICDHEIEILQTLQEECLKNTVEISRACHLCAQLDCHLAFAEVARQRNYNKPDMTHEKVLDIQEGLHPIYEHILDTFIANNTSLVENNETKSIMLLTGANYSGKTVYLMQCALIVYMAHLGSFVPAKRSRIGITDRILSRLSNRESVSRVKSSFMTDLEQVSSIFRLATPSSLVLVDEFGKGTDVLDGAALFGAMIQYFQCLGNSCPKVLASTHFHELLEQNIINHDNIKLAHMQVLLSEELDGNKSGPITYLYKLKDGKAFSSFGISCASLCGIDDEITSKAQLFYDELIKGEDISRHFMTFSEAESLKLKRASVCVRKFIGENIKNVRDVHRFLQSLVHSA